MIDLEEFPTSEIAKEMLESVTKGWYDRSYIGKWLYQVMGMSMDHVKQLYEELPYQFFVETATWGLAYHEQKYGLPIRSNLGYPERRRLIQQRQKSRVPMTPYNMEQVLAQRMGITAEISDVHDSGSLGFHPSHPNHFQVVVWERDANSELDFGMLETVLGEINQSHTTFATEHRQIFQKHEAIYAGALQSIMVEYEIKSRPINRDVEVTIHGRGMTALDMMIFEEIGGNDGNYAGNQ